jgi:phosphoribosylformylglycinamidine synthase subunit I (EC 6.3.5.3)
VLKFPGTNGDYDVLRALGLAGLRGELVWHRDYKSGLYDAVVLAGGFSYGDYLRAGRHRRADRRGEAGPRRR